MKTLLCTLVLATLGTAVAKADDVTITLDLANQSIIPGQAIQFFGTITNDTETTIYLNSDDLNLAGASLSTTDQFFNTVPISLAPGANSGDIELFDVTASDPLLDTPGVYDGVYTLFGGTDGNAQDNLGQVEFSVDTAAPSAVPEPSSIYLLISGIGAAQLLAFRRRSSLS
jgi:hypothetical protein